MGQQHRKVVKRRRRKAYLNRKKERDKAGITLGNPRAKSADGVKAAAKKAAKKPAAKKAAPAKVKKEDEVAATAPEAEAAAPEAEGAAPAES